MEALYLVLLFLLGLVIFFALLKMALKVIMFLFDYAFVILILLVLLLFIVGV